MSRFFVGARVSLNTMFTSLLRHLVTSSQTDRPLKYILYYNRDFIIIAKTKLNDK